MHVVVIPMLGLEFRSPPMTQAEAESVIRRLPVACSYKLPVDAPPVRTMLDQLRASAQMGGVN